MDTRLFLLINRLPHTPLSDFIALTLSGIGSYGVIWIFIVCMLFIYREKRHPLYFIPIVSALGTAYVLGSLILKPLLGRIRPDVSIGAIIVDRLNEGYSFPSGHATLAFTGAVLISAYERKLKIPAYILAVLIALSRVYLGKHYPLDIAAGAILGYAIGKINVYGHGPIIRKHI